MRRALARLPYYLLPGLGSVVWIAAFIGVIGLGPRMMNIDGDLGRHLTIGRYILSSGRIPTADLFSHTLAGQPLTPHEWLAQVIFALAERWLGLDGVVLVCGLVIATSFWLVFRRALDESRSLLAAVALAILAMAAASLHWLTRPHLFTFLMLALWMAAIQRLRRGDLKRWWLLPLIMLAWANLHGGFIAGPVTWALYGLGLAWDRLWGRLEVDRALPPGFWRAFLSGGAAALAATLLNPVGLGVWRTGFGFLGSRYLVSHTAEYLPPNFQDASTWPFLALIGLALLVFGLQARRLDAARVLPAAAWLVMGLYSVRNVPLFAIVAAPLLAAGLGDMLAEGRDRLAFLGRLYRLDGRLLRTDIRLRGMLWPALAVALVWSAYAGGARLDFTQQGNRFSPQVFPVQAVDYLAAHPQDGPMFNYFPWGGYLLYRLWPAQRVFIDGQTDFYGEALTRQYEQVLTLAPGWQSVLDQYHVRWVLVPPGEPLAAALKAQPSWKTLYQDSTAVLLALTP